MRQNITEQKITEIISPVFEDMGYRLVCVISKTEGKDQVLQIMAENPETHNLGVDECAKISREISLLLDVEDVLKSAYRLEVSSPGIDRPLISEQDFNDYCGFDVKVEIEPPLVTGQKRFRGIIEGIKDHMIVLNTVQERVELPYKDVTMAKLVLTDALIKKAQKTG